MHCLMFTLADCVPFAFKLNKHAESSVPSAVLQGGRIEGCNLFAASRTGCWACAEWRPTSGCPLCSNLNRNDEPCPQDKVSVCFWAVSGAVKWKVQLVCVANCHSDTIFSEWAISLRNLDLGLVWMRGCFIPRIGSIWTGWNCILYILSWAIPIAHFLGNIPLCWGTYLHKREPHL